MTVEHRPGAAAPRTVVFLPCHTLDDFPTWLDDREADDLLAAWTAAWHPRLVAAGGMPGWAGVDLPPPPGWLLGIVPAAWDDRFSVQAAGAVEGRVVRGIRGRDAIAAAALAAVDEPASANPADRWTDDFQALGLAYLLAELLARRMRTDAGSETAGLTAAVQAAAAAAVNGSDAEVRAGLGECFRCLEALRARYYPVDAWLVDFVLLADSTPGGRLREELAAGTPVGVWAGPQALAGLAARDPDALGDLRRRIEEGTVSAVGGPACDRPLDVCTPEEILESFASGAAAWEDAVGRRPAVFARAGGGGSAILPQVLAGLGAAGAVWGTFDGGPLPDPEAGRILWEGSGGTAIEAVARPPLDARSAASVLALPGRLGDAMDHDHVAVVTFARYAGTGGEWHRLLRRIGLWSTALGTFATPDDLLRRTAGAGMAATFGPDAFPPTPPPPDAAGLEAAVAAVAAGARRCVERAAEIAALVPAGEGAATVSLADVSGSRAAGRGVSRWWGWGRRADADLVLESASIRVAVHPETGGILALREPGSGPNRLSQLLATWGPEGHGRMRAESIERGTTASGVPGIISRGRLLDASGRDAGRFVQGLSLVTDQPLVLIDIELCLSSDIELCLSSDIELCLSPEGGPPDQRCLSFGAGGGPGTGPLAEHHVACRFAWHENEDLEIRRGIHLQAVPTDRKRFTAPHFLELVPMGLRGKPAAAVAILCGGLPWHRRSGPHVLDTIVAGAAGTVNRRLAVGIGLQRPWDAALELLAGPVPGSGPRLGPGRVRVTVHKVETLGGGVVRARIGLVECEGQAGPVRVQWARDVVAAVAHEFDGRERHGSSVAADGRGIVVFLRAYEWLMMDLEFAG